MKPLTDKENTRLSVFCTVLLAAVVGTLILGSVLINHALYEAEKEIASVVGDKRHEH